MLILRCERTHDHGPYIHILVTLCECVCKLAVFVYMCRECGYCEIYASSQYSVKMCVYMILLLVSYENIYGHFRIHVSFIDV